MMHFSVPVPVVKLWKTECVRWNTFFLSLKKEDSFDIGWINLDMLNQILYTSPCRGMESSHRQKVGRGRWRGREGLWRVAVYGRSFSFYCSDGGWWHTSREVFDSSELDVQKRQTWQCVCYVYFATVKIDRGIFSWKLWFPVIFWFIPIYQK